MLYDTYTSKHKVRMDGKLSFLPEDQCIWLRLIHEVRSSILNDREREIIKMYGL